MKQLSVMLAAVTLVAALVGGSPPAKAEVVEEIVAWVNGDIITSSELQEEEQLLTAEAYRRFTGDELDEQVKRVKENQLLQMIDRKILLSRVRRVYDVDQMKESFFESFKQQQGYDDEAELERMLAKEGMTLEELKDRLLEMFAPEEAVRLEVGRRIAVGEDEVRAYYDAHPDEFVPTPEVTLREIVMLASTPEDKERRRPDAEEARRRIVEGGEPFADVARDVSDAGTADEGGMLGELKKGDLSGQLEDVAFSLPVGAVSPVLEMPYGFHIIQIESRTESSPKPFDEVKDQLRQHLEDTKYHQELQVYKQKARREAEWCVKAKYVDRLPEELRDKVCANF